MDIQTSNMNRKIAIQKEQKHNIRNEAKQFLQKQGIQQSIVDKLEVYIAGDEAWLSATPNIPSKGLLNDLETQPFPVINFNIKKGVFEFTEKGKTYFGV